MLTLQDRPGSKAWRAATVRERRGWYRLAAAASRRRWRPSGAQVLAAAFAAGFVSAVVAQGVMTNLVLLLAG